MEKKHIFERADLGKAPFKYVGYSEERGPKYLGNGLWAGAPGQPMGSCDYCGTGIAHVFHVKSADGHRFKVGSECVKKLGDAGLRRVISAEVRKHQLEREERRIQAVRAIWDACERLRIECEDYHHPSPYMNKQGLSYRDYVEFMFDGNGGHSGCLRVARKLEKILMGMERTEQ